MIILVHRFDVNGCNFHEDMREVFSLPVTLTFEL